MGGYQNYGPLLSPLNTRCLITIGPQKNHSFDNHPYSPIGILPNISDQTKEINGFGVGPKGGPYALEAGIWYECAYGPYMDYTGNPVLSL